MHAAASRVTGGAGSASLARSPRPDGRVHHPVVAVGTHAPATDAHAGHGPRPARRATARRLGPWVTGAPALLALATVAPSVPFTLPEPLSAAHAGLVAVFLATFPFVLPSPPRHRAVVPRPLARESSTSGRQPRAASWRPGPPLKRRPPAFFGVAPQFIVAGAVYDGVAGHAGRVPDRLGLPAPGSRQGVGAASRRREDCPRLTWKRCRTEQHGVTLGSGGLGSAGRCRTSCVPRAGVPRCPSCHRNGWRTASSHLWAVLDLRTLGGPL
jgi:hypothetical protein